MDSTTPKISFIPKGSLVREDPFLERQRPRSIAGFFAIFLFVSVVSAYAGLYYYNNSLNRQILDKTSLIKDAQEEFNKSPEVAEAKIFRARADIANELLKNHMTVSPIITFLEKNTMESIMYDKFSFKNDAGVGVLEVTGEAPTYGALSYQTDFLRKKGNELSKFSLSSFSLTPLGTVTFAFVMTFNPQHLLYESKLKSIEPSSEVVSDSATADPFDTKDIFDELVPIDAIGEDVATTTESEESDVAKKSDTVVDAEATPKENPSRLRVLWDKFKFW